MLVDKSIQNFVMALNWVLTSERWDWSLVISLSLYQIASFKKKISHEISSQYLEKLKAQNVIQEQF